MTRDDIIKLAREACHPDTADAWHNGYWTLTQPELERFAALVAAHEREACAQIAEEWLGPTKDRELHIAAAIRSRE